MKKPISSDNKDRKLLKDRRVIDEINRHLWIESEKAGFDIGFDKASQDWLKNFSKAWMSYHMPKKKPSPKQSSKRKAAPKKTSRGKKRRAKSFIK